MARELTKKKMIAVRLTEWEAEQLKKATKITKQSTSAFIVMAMLEKAQKVKGGK